MWAMFRLLPIAIQIGIAAGAFAIVMGAATGVYFHIEGKGYDRAIAEVAEQNAQAKALVKRATKKVDDCEANGGAWDVTVGRCN
jgi:hypothetical protein